MTTACERVAIMMRVDFTHIIVSDINAYTTIKAFNILAIILIDFTIQAIEAGVTGAHITAHAVLAGAVAATRLAGTIVNSWKEEAHLKTTR